MEGTRASMADSVARFYDGLADEYHLLFADWDASVRRQGEILDRAGGRLPRGRLVPAEETAYYHPNLDGTGVAMDEGGGACRTRSRS